MTPTATPAQRKERLAAVEALALQRWTEALMDHRATDAKSYAISAAIAVDKAQLLEGLPTEILGGLPEYQGSLTAILARVERVHGQPLALPMLLSPSTSTNTPTTPKSTTSDSTSTHTLEHYAPMTLPPPSTGVVNPSELETSLKKERQPADTKPRRRFMGRKDHWSAPS